MTGVSLTESGLPSAQRAALYELVSHLLLAELNADMAQRLSRPGVIEVLEQLGAGSRELLHGFGEARCEQAAEEYARLFILSGGVAPRGAAWMAGELETAGVKISQQAQHYLRILGHRPEPGPWGQLPLDHLGLLLRLAAVACNTPYADEVNAALVEPWARPFGEALTARTEHPIYRAVGALLVLLANVPEDVPAAVDSASRTSADACG